MLVNVKVEYTKVDMIANGSRGADDADVVLAIIESAEESPQEATGACVGASAVASCPVSVSFTAGNRSQRGRSK